MGKYKRDYNADGLTFPYCRYHFPGLQVSPLFRRGSLSRIAGLTALPEGITFPDWYMHCHYKHRCSVHY